MLVIVRILMIAVGFDLYVNGSEVHDDYGGGLISSNKIILNRRCRFRHFWSTSFLLLEGTM
jgi:hypothetical protein